MRLYQLDAFTDRLFAGNPAAVVPLTDWLSDEQMQQIGQLAAMGSWLQHTSGGPDVAKY